MYSLGQIIRNTWWSPFEYKFPLFEDDCGSWVGQSGRGVFEGKLDWWGRWAVLIILEENEVETVGYGEMGWAAYSITFKEMGTSHTEWDWEDANQNLQKQNKWCKYFLKMWI